MPPRAASMAVDQATARRRAPLGRSVSEGRPEPAFLPREEARTGGEESRRSRCADKPCRRQTCHEREAGAAYAPAQGEARTGSKKRVSSAVINNRGAISGSFRLALPQLPPALDRYRLIGTTGSEAWLPSQPVPQTMVMIMPPRGPGSSNFCPISWLSIFLPSVKASPDHQPTGRCELRGNGGRCLSWAPVRAGILGRA